MICTYAPVAHFTSISMVLTLAAHKDMEIRQNGKLNEDEVIYMQQPPGYASMDHSSTYVC